MKRIIVYDSASDDPRYASTLLPSVAEEAREMGVETAYIFYNPDGRSNGLVFEKNQFDRWLDNVPDDAKLGCIDREAGFFQGLAAEQQWAFDELEAMTMYAGNQRPDIQWTLWGYPMRQHGIQNRHLWQLDWLNPCVYDNELTVRPWQGNRQRIETIRTVGACAYLDLQVIPSVRYRYPQSITVIPEQEWLGETILPALKAGAAGIALWGKGNKLIWENQPGITPDTEAELQLSRLRLLVETVAEAAGGTT